MLSSMIIAKKEIKTTLKGPGFYFIAFMMCFLVSYMSFELIKNLYQQAQIAGRMGGNDGVNVHQAYVAQIIYLMHFFLVLFIPALTAFSFAEEKKTRTLDLLLTSPIHSIDIVLGKYVANLLLVVVLIAFSLLYTVPMHFISPVDWSLLGASYLGLFLISAIYVGAGIFASSLTSSVIISFVIALVLNLFCIFIVWGSQSTESEIVREVINHLSITKRLMEFIQGNIQTSGIIFLLSLVGLFVALTHRVIESARWR